MPAIIAVCGVKNSGKTTLVSKLVSRLSGEGYKVAVIKHDGHDFTCDVPGTDTFRFTESGAYGVACFSAHRMFVHKAGTGETEEELIGLFPEADLLLIEGLKDSAYPKIEVIRRAISDRPASNPDGRFLLTTDWPSGTFAEPCVALDDIDAAAEAVKRRMDELR